MVNSREQMPPNGLEAAIQMALFTDASPVGRRNLADGDRHVLPGGADFETFLTICRAANKAGHPEEEIVDAAARMHWQLHWARRYHRGKKLRRHQGHPVVKGVVSVPPRHSMPKTDLRRMQARLTAEDADGFGKAFVEASPYTQDLVKRAMWKAAPTTRLFRPQLPVAPGHYRLVRIAINAATQEPGLDGRPRKSEHDRSVRWLRSLFEWLTGRHFAGASVDPRTGRPHGQLHGFILAVSEAYGVPLVSASSAHRLRRPR